MAQSCQAVSDFVGDDVGFRVLGQEQGLTALPVDGGFEVGRDADVGPAVLGDGAGLPGADADAE